MSPDPLPSDEATRVASSGDEPTLTAESCIEPSDEAVEAAWREAHEASRDYIAQPTVRAALTAAYRIDMPRREAEVRAATLREVEALREALDMAIYHADNLRRFISNVPVRDLAESEAGFQRAKAIAARFNPETEL